jgi:hypothetical protein
MHFVEQNISFFHTDRSFVQHIIYTTEYRLKVTFKMLQNSICCRNSNELWMNPSIMPVILEFDHICYVCHYCDVTAYVHEILHFCLVLLMKRLVLHMTAWRKEHNSGIVTLITPIIKNLSTVVQLLGGI